MKKHITTLLLLFVFSSISLFAQQTDNQLHFVAKKNSYRLYNGDELVSKAKYRNHSQFSEGLCAVMNSDGQWGFINTKGEVMIPLQYPEVSDFDGGTSFVHNRGNYIVIDKAGKQLNELNYVFIDKFTNGIAIAMSKNEDTTKYGRYEYVFSLIQRSGKPVSDDLYTAISQINDSIYQALIYNSEYRVYADGRKELIGELKYCGRNSPKKDSTIKEEDPSFIGGERGRMDFLRNNIRYPEMAKELGCQGTVYVTFVIDKEGAVRYPNIIRGVCPSIDVECIKLIRKMPQWKAGTEKGKPKNTVFNMPIRFFLAG
jgi:TonB family protein